MIQFHSNLGNNNIPFLDTGFENKLHNERVQNCFLLGFDIGSYAWEPIVITAKLLSCDIRELLKFHMPIHKVLE